MRAHFQSAVFFALLLNSPNYPIDAYLHARGCNVCCVYHQLLPGCFCWIIVYLQHILQQISMANFRLKIPCYLSKYLPLQLHNMSKYRTCINMLQNTNKQTSVCAYSIMKCLGLVPLTLFRHVIQYAWTCAWSNHR